MKKSNIGLIGMPGAGKSTVGVLLAKAAGMPFVDTDLLIQEREGLLLQEIIDNHGLEYFLQAEEEVVLSLRVKNHVIATGGSVIYSGRALEHLREGGFLFYLKLSLGEIGTRISNITTRGLAMSGGQSLKDLYEERVPLYEQNADAVVDCRDKHIEQVVEEIRDAAAQLLDALPRAFPG